MQIQKNKVQSKEEKLQALQERYSQIKNHPFSNFTTKKIVWGTGNIDSKLLFLGEGPGANEDKVGKPFIGRAGQLLTKIIEDMGLKRERDVFITNVIKCRLDNNRAPQPEETEYEKAAVLNKELKILSPKIICCLGSSATKAMLGNETKLGVVRGKFIKQNNWLIMPTYHPAYLLRNPAAKKVVWEDVKLIIEKLQTL